MNSFKPYRWTLLGIISVLYFFVCLHRVAPTVVARDMAQSFQADAVTLGLIASAYFYLYSVLQPVVGYLSDTVSPRKVMALFFALSAVGTLIFGSAPNALIAMLGRTLIGAGLAGIFIPALKLFSRWYRVDQYAGLTGLMLTVGGLGSISAAVPLTYLVVLSGWRNAFIGIGAFSFILALVCWIVVRDKPEEKGWPSPGIAFSPADKDDGIGIRKKLGMISGSLDFWMIFLGTFFTGGASLTFQGLWSIPYLMDVFGLDRVHAGWILMLFPLGIALGGPTLGFLIENLHLNQKRVLLGGLLITALGWIVMLTLNRGDSVIIVALLLFIFGLTAGGTLPFYYTITRNLFPAWLMGTASGLMNAAAFLGAAVYQPFTGYLLKSFSVHPGVYSVEAYRLLLVAFFASYVVAFVATLLLRPGKISAP